MEDIANIGLICFLMGIGIVGFLAIAAVYLISLEFLETFYLNDKSTVIDYESIYQKTKGETHGH